MKLLSNIHLPVTQPHTLRTFLDYLPGLAPRPEGKPGLKYASMQDILAKMPEPEYPDALIISSPEYLPIPEDLPGFSGLKILLLTDWNVCTRFLKDICPLFDYCFTDIAGVELLESWGLRNVHHQPLFGHNPEVFRRLEHGNPVRPVHTRNIDVSFCGNFNSNMHLERNRLLYRLSRLSGKHRLYIGQVFGGDYVRLLNRSKLVWNHSIRREANMRTFEAMACGAVPLIESSNQEVPLLFQPGRHYVKYSVAMLEEAIHGILDNPERLAFMQAEAARAVGEHTRERQIKSLLNMVMQSEKTAKGKAKRPAPTEVATGPGPSGAVVKTNFLTGVYNYPGPAGKLREKFRSNPELERHIMPAEIVAGIMGSGTDDDLQASRDLLETTYLADASLPGYLRAYFRSVVHQRQNRYRECIRESETCVSELRDFGFQNLPPEHPDSPYRYLIPPLKLGSSFAVDSNRSYVEDARNGSCLMFSELLRDNCLAAAARGYLKTGEPGEALVSVRAMSGHGFLSAPKPVVLASLLVESESLTVDQDTLMEAFRYNPLNSSCWSFLLKGLYQLGDMEQWTRFFQECITTAGTIFHQDRDTKALLQDILQKYKGAGSGGQRS